MLSIPTWHEPEIGYCPSVLLSNDELAGPPQGVFARAGWELKPEGACQGDTCVPLGDATTVEAIAQRLGMALVSDEPTGLRSLGPASARGHALSSVQAPDLELPLALSDGVWRLADQRGRRTVIVAWAPW